MYFFNIRDRIRTSINVLGDAYGAGIVYHLNRESLRKQDAAEAAALAIEDHDVIVEENGRQAFGKSDSSEKLGEANA